MSELVKRTDGALAANFTDVLKSAASYARADKSEATKLAYRSDWRDFAGWCEQLGASPMPAAVETVAAYLAHLADSGRKASTITRRTAAIAYAHRLAGIVSPPTSAEPVKAVLRGIRRRIGVAVQRKAPATARAITAMLRRVPDTLIGKRDKAILLIGFSAALRRSELVGLQVGDVRAVGEGTIVHIRRSKTDQEGQGHDVAVPRGTRLKPVEALEAWLTAAQITEGPIFRPIGKGGRVKSEALTGESVARIVKRYAKLAKLDPEMFAGHSLRAGFVTSALETGADLLKIMDVTRHRSVETLKGYDRRAKAFVNHAGRKFL
jgi:site-specific recombinase XerD